MLGRKEWRIKTPFNEVVVRLDSFVSSDSSDADAGRSLLAELLFEFRNRNPEVVRSLLELRRALSGTDARSTAQDFSPVSAQLGFALDQELRTALEHGRLSVEPKPPTLVRARPRDIVPFNLGPQATVDEVTSFIGVRVLDATGAPVVGEAVRVELPDGSSRNLRTGADGTILIDGLSPGGTATVTLPDQNDPGDAEAPEPHSSFEVQFVDETGQPIPGIEAVFNHSGQDESQLTDASGVAKVDSLDAVTVTIADLQALSDILFARWLEPRPTATPSGDDVVSVPLSDQFGAQPLVASKRRTIVITPPAGELVFRLIDQDGEPVADREFLVTLPDGAERTGTTDSEGFARVDDVPAGGQAQITFPDFDENDFAFAPALPGTRGTDPGPLQEPV